MANPTVPYDFIGEIDQSNPNLSIEFDSLQCSPLDMDFLSNDLLLPDDLMEDLGFGNEFDFSFDDLSFPPIDEGFLAEGSDVLLSSNPNLCEDSSDRPLGEVSGVLNSSLPGSGNCGRDSSGTFSVQDSGGCKSVVSERIPNVCQNPGDPPSGDISRVFNSSSPDSGNCVRDSSGPVSDQDSGEYRSAVTGFLNSASPNSVIVSESSGSPNSCNVSSDAMAMDERKECSLKRKKQDENPCDSKYQRPLCPSNNVNSSQEEDKRKARLIRNRESAQLSRERKKNYVQELEHKVRSMHSTIASLNSKISFIMAENASLHHQLGQLAVGDVFPPSMAAPMHYPWIPCSSYTMRPQSQVPLVPIPRLKPQQPILASKAKKSKSKSKKVASVSFLGLLFFLLLFGGLVPFVNVRYKEKKEMVPNGLGLITNSFYVQPRGSVLAVNNSDQTVGVVGLCSGKPGFREDDNERVLCERSWTEGVELEVQQNKHGSRPFLGSDGFVRLGNSSEPLVASLYVPRNDKLVKIDGNLIIHSVMASEKAMASLRYNATVPSANKDTQTGLAIVGNLGSALATGGKNVQRSSNLYRSPTMGQNALPSGSRDAYKDTPESIAADGLLQNWFREGLAGPILSSGMCTEVFQFEVSPGSANQGGMIPASSITNVSAKHPPGSAPLKKRMNRRILNRLPIPLAESAFNETEEHVGRASQNENINSNDKSVSSMVVSVLFDPKGADNSVDDGVISSSNSLARIFVVVLLDSVKYVTYSCMLPLKGSALTW